MTDLTARITEILQEPVRAYDGSPLYLNLNERRLNVGGAREFAALIAAAAEEHYRRRIETVEQHQEWGVRNGDVVDLLPSEDAARTRVAAIVKRFWRQHEGVSGAALIEPHPEVVSRHVTEWSPGAGE